MQMPNLRSVSLAAKLYVNSLDCQPNGAETTKLCMIRFASKEPKQQRASDTPLA